MICNFVGPDFRTLVRGPIPLTSEADQEADVRHYPGTKESEGTGTVWRHEMPLGENMPVSPRIPPPHRRCTNIFESFVAFHTSYQV